MKWHTQTKALDCGCAGKCWRTQKPLECRDGSRGWSKFPGIYLPGYKEFLAVCVVTRLMMYGGAVLLPGPRPLLWSFSSIDSAILSYHLQVPEISYTANTPYCKEPFLVAPAWVFHQSGFFSTQPWPFKHSGESEKSYPPPYLALFSRNVCCQRKGFSKPRKMINVLAEKRFYMFTVKYSKWPNSSYSLIVGGVCSIQSCLISF